MWNIIRNADVISLIPDGDPLPPGAEVIGQTIDADALKPPVLPVPAVVTRFQGRGALALTTKFLNGETVNLFSAIQAFMLTLPETDLWRRAWEDTQSFERTSPLVAVIASMFGLSEEEVDDLFRLADTIKT